MLKLEVFRDKGDRIQRITNLTELKRIIAEESTEVQYPLRYRIIQRKT